MTKLEPIARSLSVAGAALMLLLLSGCFLSPGKFDSSLDIRKNGEFTFAYDGEMYFLALSDFAQRDAAFTPSACTDEDTFEERDCTAEELRQQRSDWEAKREKDKEEAKQMATMFGGIDPSDPNAAQQMAAALRKQKGWRSVEYKGDGLFVVSFELTSKAGHSFAFPSIEGFPMANAFVQISPRADGSLRVDAPAFGPAGGNPMAAMMAGATGMKAPGGEDAPQMPEISGTFTIVTDGQILANNTDEGPVADAKGQKLNWTISRLGHAPPMALIRLGE